MADRISAAAPDAAAQLKRLERRVEREKRARQEAEQIAEQKTAEAYVRHRQLDLLQNVAAAANGADALEQAIPGALRAVCEYTGWPLGHAWLVGGDGMGVVMLRSSGIWYRDEEHDYAPFCRLSEKIGLREGEGLPGRVAATATPVWLEDIHADGNFPRANDHAADSIESAFAFPVLDAGNVVAVLEFFSPRRREPDEQFLGLLAEVGAQLSRAAERGRANAELTRVADELKRSEQRYQLAARGANDGIWDWNLETDEVFFSSRWKAILGYAEADIGADIAQWLGRVHPDDVARVEAELDSHLTGQTAQLASEHRLRGKDGNWHWVLCRGLGIHEAGHDKATRMAGSLTDISDRKRTEQKLRHDALHDPLTGLPNRALFLDRVTLIMSRAKRDPSISYAVMYFDFDGFKIINDSLGHAAGDAVLKTIGARLLAHFRGSDTVARLGGDEFAVLVDGCGPAGQVMMLAERAQQTVNMPMEVGGKELTVSTSIGIAMGAPTYESPDDVMRDADTAMYRAKAGGRARQELFDASMHDDALQLLTRVTDLRHLLDGASDEQLELHYQPIVQVSSGSINGVEALIRWQHPEAGSIPPDEFIPLAEEHGLIMKVTRWVLRTALRDMHAIDAAVPGLKLFVSINLCGQDFQDDSLVHYVQRLVDRYGVDPARLHFELTERTVMEGTEAAIAMFDRFRALGVRLSVDDFGTGYSSLSYLHRFPFDSLKIDRAFVSGLAEADKNRNIVRSIMALGEALELDVIAEGVETAQAAEHLLRLGVPSAQGYWYAKPAPLQELLALIVGWQAEQKQP